MLGSATYISPTFMYINKKLRLKHLEINGFDYSRYRSYQLAYSIYYGYVNFLNRNCGKFSGLWTCNCYRGTSGPWQPQELIPVFEGINTQRDGYFEQWFVINSNNSMVECNKNMIMLCGRDGFSEVPHPKSEIKVILNKHRSKQSIN